MNELMTKVCDFLQQEGFILVSQPGYRTQIFVLDSLVIKVDDKNQEKTE
jgi:hypothetical protein